MEPNKSPCDKPFQIISVITPTNVLNVDQSELGHEVQNRPTGLTVETAPLDRVQAPPSSASADVLSPPCKPKHNNSTRGEQRFDADWVLQSQHLAGRDIGPLTCQLLVEQAMQLQKQLNCSCQRCSSLVPRLCKGMSMTNNDVCVLNYRSWLEALDKRHRYSKNLRHYYREWCRLNCPGDNFWSWLDTGDTDLSICPRSELDIQTVKYLTVPERGAYQVQIKEGLLVDIAGNLLNTEGRPWIFVMSTDKVLYSGAKQDKKTPRFQHTSFLGGAAVLSAGQLSVAEGRLMTVSPHSGHYRPSGCSLLRFLQHLHAEGVQLSHVMVDVQRLVKVARETDSQGLELSKSYSKRMFSAEYTRWLLENQQRIQELDLFRELKDRVHKRGQGRRSPPQSAVGLMKPLLQCFSEQDADMRHRDVGPSAA